MRTSRLLFLLGLVFLSISATAFAQGVWQPLAPFPAPPRGVVGVAALGKIYVFAGLQDKSVPLGMVYEYDPQKNAWAARKQMPMPAHHVAITEYNGKIYLFGGFKKPASGQEGWEPVDSSWEYNPQADTWKALKPMPSKRGAAAAAVVSGKIYVMGGAALHPGSKDMPLVSTPEVTPHRTLDTVEEYDVASNTWRDRITMPTPRNHFVLAAVNGKLYAVGGRMGSVFFDSASETDGVEEYDPAADTWGVARQKISTPRSAMSWGVYKDRIYVAGGEMMEGNVAVRSFRNVEAFEPATNLWYVLPLVPSGRAPVTGAVIKDTFYLVSSDNAGEQKTPGKMATYPFDAMRLDSFK